MAKYGMSMCVLGMSEEFKDDGIAVNALWPKTGNVLFVCLFVFLFLALAKYYYIPWRSYQFVPFHIMASSHVPSCV